MNDEYFSELKKKISDAYDIASKARAEAIDPDIEVEAIPAGDLATRVEGLVGLAGIASKIRKFGRSNITNIIDDILGEDVIFLKKEEIENRIEKAIRTALAILTEGVVAAPIEGIAKVKILDNPDGSRYISIYFSGPIRSAGGTAQGISVVFADYIQKKLKLQGYRPTNEEIERYVEEIKLYNDRISRLQYLPSDDEIREILKNLPVCVDGDPTEEMEVAIHRDLKRVETNRIRSGMCLVIAEGIAQKSAKVMKYAASIGLDWSWLASIKKVNTTANNELKPQPKFMLEIVGGRPIFSSQSKKGGFRLRYGRSRASGIAAKCIHPATQILLDNFIATGTQLKIESPGKGCVITPCDEIECPVVKLKDGSVLRVETTEMAKKLKEQVQEILFLGDILISYGDFLQSNTPLMSSGYCEEFWIQELKEVAADLPREIKKISAIEAIEISKKFSVPLHPRYTYPWEDISIKELEKLANWFFSGKIEDKFFVLQNNDCEAKRVLECLYAEHQVRDDKIFIEENTFLPLLMQMGIYNEGKISKENFVEKIKEFSPDDNAFDFIEKISNVKIRRKIGTYIAARMGRPEKAKERKLAPPVHSLFPVGLFGGKERSINVAAEKNIISVELANFKCEKCNSRAIFPICQKCGEKTTLKRICPLCKNFSDEDICIKCKARTVYYDKQDIDLATLWKNAIDNVGHSEVKGVIGLISTYKIPELLEKGILRAKNSLYVFKDGTIRYDATNVPLTHFKPKEANVSIEKLKKLGYEKDIEGNELKSDEQILELKVQDIILNENGLEYLFRVSKFVDEELEKIYHMKKFYNAENKEDLIGALVVGLAPHTSAGIVGRIIGTTRANVCFAHPYWHAAKRRNCDGDEDSIMLLLDVLLNFSRKYLPEKRGGQMDAPLVISTILDAKEVDDEVHKMEIVSEYGIEFYRATQERKNPADIKIATVQSILKTDPYSGIKFTHSTSDISGEVLESNYVKLKAMMDKVNSQLRVAEKIRAVDENEVAELVINSHFLRDCYGNLRAFSKQKFRCIKCNKSYRRIPLIGKCTKCGGKLLLTVTEGTIRKYIEISLKLIERYKVSQYLRQRIILLQKEIDSLFMNDLSKQVCLGDFM
ncbi:MAG: DNA polymerase II large subunit [Candidatus Altiarchaeota archaeon]